MEVRQLRHRDREGCGAPASWRAAAGCEGRGLGCGVGVSGGAESESKTQRAWATERVAWCLEVSL